MHENSPADYLPDTDLLEQRSGQAGQHSNHPSMQ